MKTGFSPRARAITIGLAFLIGLALLSRLPHVLAPFLWAVITAYVFQPLINLVVRVTRLPRGLVAIALYFALVAALVLSVISLFPVIRSQTVGLVGQVPGTANALVAQLEQRFPVLMERLELDPTMLQRQLQDLTHQWTASVPKTALTVVQRLLNFLLEFFVYLIATFYFLLQGDRIVLRMRDLFPHRYRGEIDRLLGEINATLGAYLRGQLLLVAIMSATTYLALRIYGVEYAIILALATGFLELIPIIGPWTAGAIAVTVALLQPMTPFGWTNTSLAIAVGITYFVLRQLEDNLVIPTLIGRIVHLHPLVMIFIILIGTKLGGILGLLLAVPLATMLKILVGYLWNKATADEVRRIVVLDDREALIGLREELPALINHRLVLVPQPGALAWEDLPALHRLVAEANRIGVDLSVVTQDPVAASLAAALGLDPTVIPPNVPAPAPEALEAPTL